jgi:hypothetical protein
MKKHMSHEKVEDIAQDLSKVSGMPVTEASKHKSKTKSTKLGVNALAIAPPTLTNPAPNTLEWTMPTADELGASTPDDATDDRIVVITVVQWGDGVEPAGGLEIPQFTRMPAVTKFENGVSNYGQKSHIPLGTTSVRVAHLTAARKGDSYDAESIDKDDAIAWSAWLAAIEFK